MECYRLIEELQDMINSGSKILFSNKVLIDQEKALDIIDKLLRVLPDDIKMAKKITEDRQRILIEAQKESELILKEARDHIDNLVNQEEITKMAREKSDQILNFAKQTAREIRTAANDYADDVLEELEQHITKVLETLKAGRDELRKKR